jgi:putative membrane protein
MRYIRYASIAIFAIALILIALANRQFVEVQILPPELAGMAALNPQMQTGQVYTY